ncbi:MAG TPA: ABC transporter ATP-binding protein [Caldimonas sp.]
MSAASPAGGAALEVRGLGAGYGTTVVLEDVSFDAAAGASLAVLGRNGVGKSTLLESIFGFTTLHGGQVLVGGERIDLLAPFERNWKGLCYVPQQREIFASLSVEENLTVALRPGGWSVERVYEVFPKLKERRRNSGNRLSGGEQQMLAIGRALVGAPRVLLLDEPMEGLAPVVVDALYDALRAIRDEAGPTLVLVEQKAELALALTRDAIVLDRGRIVHRGPSAELLGDELLKGRLLGVAAEA